MAKIKIATLEPVEVEESIQTLNDIESQSIFGGEYLNPPEVINFGFKALEFILAIYAIDAITFLATSFYRREQRTGNKNPL
jgi:hypothetical protein